MAFESQTIGISDTRIIIVGGTLNLTDPPSPDRAIRHRAFDGAVREFLHQTRCEVAIYLASAADEHQPLAGWIWIVVIAFHLVRRDIDACAGRNVRTHERGIVAGVGDNGEVLNAIHHEIGI